MNRRGFLRIAGSSAVILAAGAGGFAVTRTPTEALAPWDEAGSADYTDPRVRALSYAILAPNPHNRQPWLVDLSQDGEATLLCDLDRLLKETDPFDRQITIGLGCFLETLRIASAEEGLRAEITPFPDGEGVQALDGRPIAHIRFTEDANLARDPLFAQIIHRRSNKEPYDVLQQVSDVDLSDMLGAAGTDLRVGSTNDGNRITDLRELTWQAMQVEMFTPQAMQESIDLMRIGKREINENPDGLSFGGPFFDTARLLGLMTRESLGDTSSVGFQQGLDIWEELMMTAMGYAWIITAGNSREDQLNAGRAWVRMNLKGMDLGLGLHPLSQSLQEYAEMAELYARIHDELGASGTETVQMFGRCGYGPDAPRTPRWPVETRLTGAANPILDAT